MKIFTDSVIQAHRKRYRFTEFNERITNAANGKNSAQMKALIQKLCDNRDPFEKDLVENWKQVATVFCSQILEVIYEFTMSRDFGATLAEIREVFENEILKMAFPLSYGDLTSEEIDWIVTYIVIDTLQNGGQPYTHYVPDYSSDGFRKDYYKVIEDSKQTVDGETGYYYRVTPEAINYFIQTYELEHNLDFDLQAVILTEQFNRRNYEDVERRCVGFINSVRAQIFRIDELRRRMLRNLVSVSSKEVNEEIDKFFEVVEDANKASKRIELAFDRFRKHEKLYGSEGGEMKTIRHNINNIDLLVNRIVSVVLDLVNKKGELERTRREALAAYDPKHLMGKQMLDYEKTVIDPIPKMEDASALWEIFAPMMQLRKEAIPTLEAVYLPQRTLSDSGAYAIEEFDDLEDESSSVNEDREAAEAFAKYLVYKYGYDKKSSMKSIINSMKRDGMNEILEKTALYIQALVMYGEPYVDEENGFMVESENERNGERCQFYAADTGKAMDTENLQYTVSSLRTEKLS